MFTIITFFKEKVFKMKTTQEEKVVKFMNNEYIISSLIRSIGAAVDIYVKPEEKFFDQMFDQNEFPDDIKKEVRKPILTVYNGQYVFILKPEKFDYSKGYKAKLISKYLFNRCKVKEYENEINEPETKPTYPRSYNDRPKYPAKVEYRGDKRSFDKPRGFVKRETTEGRYGRSS